MNLIPGDQLSAELQQSIKRRYLYRVTLENWYGKARNYFGATIEPIPDAQWLKEHAFYVTNAGQLSRRHNHCEPVCLAQDYYEKNK